MLPKWCWTFRRFWKIVGNFTNFKNLQKVDCLHDAKIMLDIFRFWKIVGNFTNFKNLQKVDCLHDAKIMLDIFRFCKDYRQLYKL